ncbi:bifunctional 2-C-methyl-D-erythritol 4-phosphate cytidylyltransferase/2-C-methyl-D-erythritol 2,4-cyclodiphosphate synthase [Sphingomonas flavalba]|uniref:bifunctional 2-C-methyl-D-erythritol 4-phosphate cytidylyltransferase/2-C-methyl-D-erythritol 2,4-cyclodiphosphate synthase n=1 Tax=Sphingomonas flavalba TaxID=2559804 RepID=UPI00109E01E5|nr:bifunctional 2-C-methyl-D-erythritol 4-phosphate cytidylyltransferase/2-C-methyl-D-erythritol 2,4-cyclodiphosphate synthase [Sphingomonas flavalba]
MRDRRVIGLVVAAGAGERAGGGVPKQYRRLAGRAVVARACDALAAHPAIDAVHIVIGAGQEDLLAEAFDGNPPAWTIGGATRRDSVRAGLAAIDGAIVLIHDAARPFLPAAVVDRLLAALDGADGAVPALPVADTLARGGAVLGDTVAREDLNRIQTPQAFPLALIGAAHAAWPTDEEATDDAQVARAAGHSVALVAGDAALDKLTTADDLARAEARLAAALVSRTGTGFDVHRLEAGAELWLGGVRIAHDKGLSGHSDADVALHALTDAILGAIGDGDIGSHFPPSDPQWRGAPSRLFVEHAAALVAARGGVIDHVDVTIICEAPRIGPYRDSMRAAIAALLRLPERRVSIKATTTERLGFTGRGEGIAAQAIATVRLSEDQ